MQFRNLVVRFELSEAIHLTTLRLLISILLYLKIVQSVYLGKLGTIVNTNLITFKRNARNRLERMLVLCKYSIKVIAMTGYDDRITNYMI